MLPTIFSERLGQMLGIKIEEIATETQEQLSHDSADAARRGMVHSSYTYGLFQQRRVRQIANRAGAVLEAQKTLVPLYDIPYSETLAAELKAQVSSWISREWCEQSVQSDPSYIDETMKARFREESNQARSHTLHKASVAIDLLVDGLRAKVPARPQNETKELAQKFGILLSSSQAIKDFDGWSRELGSDGGRIAVIFLDIDHFKDLNNKYTNPRVDTGILRVALPLIERMTRLRGGAYHEGGDEFIVILPNHDAVEAVNVAERILRAFENQAFRIEPDTIKATLSAGVAMWPEHGSQYEELKAKACEYQIVAKAQRNCVRLATIPSTRRFAQQA